MMKIRGKQIQPNLDFVIEDRVYIIPEPVGLAKLEAGDCVLVKCNIIKKGILNTESRQFSEGIGLSEPSLNDIVCLAEEVEEKKEVEWVDQMEQARCFDCITECLHRGFHRVCDCENFKEKEQKSSLEELREAIRKSGIWMDESKVMLCGILDEIEKGRKK